MTSGDVQLLMSAETGKPVVVYATVGNGVSASNGFPASRAQAIAPRRPRGSPMRNHRARPSANVS